MEISNKYNFKLIEEKIYSYWINGNYFHSEPNNKIPYTIVIPPPNITGILHMGHMLNNTIQDILARIARMKGYNVCWIPGLDHASIATEAKIVSQLKNEGILKSDLGRKKFLDRVWKWAYENSSIILDQLKRLGCSCDWERAKFTMDEKLYQSVIKVFIDLYHKKWIYRGYRMIYWDPEAKTSISEEEIIYKEILGKLYYIKYKINNENNFITIATTRPETIFGDTAVCIHPEDTRFSHLKNKKVIIPIVNRLVPIIQDNYVDINFGTGCLKITPAHDINDYILANKHKLNIINIFHKDATLNKEGLHYQGQDRFDVRKKIIKELKNLGFLVKIENYSHKISLSERTQSIIEPKLSMQWFLNMKEMVTPALESVMNGEIQFHPKKFKNVYKHWLSNIHDWNISRQLWWGHQIPVYYYGNNSEKFIVAENIEKALEIIHKETNNFNLTIKDIRQDLDVLDTWFSSWIWPISVFDGILHPKNPDISYYYPTQDLVTGPDILFFWVSRMIMAGYMLRNEKPFSNVYFTGIVRDKEYKKMSKSLGNSPNALELINKYGADSIRIGLLLSTQAGNDLIFDENLCLQGRNFTNKLWNAFRLIINLKTDENISPSESEQLILIWFQNRFYQVLEEIEKDFLIYKISNGLIKIYKLVWDDFCSLYLEIIKPTSGQAISTSIFNKTIKWFEKLLKILHPYIPFITEKIWQYIKSRSLKEALIISSWPQKKPYNIIILNQFKKALQIITHIRHIRKSHNIPYKKKLSLYIMIENKKIFFKAIIIKLSYIEEFLYVQVKPKTKIFSFYIDSNEYFISINKNIDYSKEIKKLKNDFHYQKEFLMKIRKNLLNKKFISYAPKNIITHEYKKEHDCLKRIKLIKKNLEELLKK